MSRRGPQRMRGGHPNRPPTGPSHRATRGSNGRKTRDLLGRLETALPEHAQLVSANADRSDRSRSLI